MDELAVATMRTLSVDARLKAQSMHTFGASAPLEDLEEKLASARDAITDAAWGLPTRGAAA